MWIKSGVILLSLLVVVAKAEIPSYIKRCKAGDGPCIAEAATELFATAAEGRKDLGTPQFDPLEISKILFNVDIPERSVNADLHIKNAILKGMSGFVITKVAGFERDPINSKFELYGDLPKLQITGKYKAKAHFLQIPIEGDGEFTIIAENSKFAVKIKPAVEVRDGHTYLRIEKLKARLEPKKVKIHIGNLVPQNPSLGENINQLLNENWPAAWEEMAPSIMPIAEAAFKDIAQNLLNQFPYDEIYLPE